VDSQFARLREGLEALGYWDDLVVVVVADHGEEFWDHGGFEHGHTHFLELIHVPLIVKRPGGPSGVVNANRVRQLDLAPSVCRWAGVSVPDAMPGLEMETTAAKYAIAEGTLYGGGLISARSDQGTLILDRASGGMVFFAAGDIHEEAPQPWNETVGRLESMLRAIPTVRPQAEKPWQLTKEQQQRLRSLGYLQ
jgi:arylsulfatase A-like enzyme